MARLTQQQVDALPLGAEVWVSWSGGWEWKRGPYIIDRLPDSPVTYVTTEGEQEWGRKHQSNRLRWDQNKCLDRVGDGNGWQGVWPFE